MVRSEERPPPDRAENHDLPGFASVLDIDRSTAFAAALHEVDSASRRFTWWCARYPCFANRGRTYVTLGLAACLAIVVALYFTVPWVPILEDILDWIKGKGIWGTLLLFVLHNLAMLSIFGPLNTIEYGWVFLRGWKAVPIILVSYILGIGLMLSFGNTVLRPCILRRVQGSRLMQATQRVLDNHPYAWYFAFQYWDFVPWRASVYCAHVLAPHAVLFVVGIVIFIGQMPQFFYRVWIATLLTDLDSLVTGRLDTPLKTAIFWVSIVIASAISLVLYFKIRNAFMEATGWTNNGENGGNAVTESSREQNHESSAEPNHP